jgi:hypothetical protein
MGGSRDTVILRANENVLLVCLHTCVILHMVSISRIEQTINIVYYDYYYCSKDNLEHMHGMVDRMAPRSCVNLFRSIAFPINVKSRRSSQATLLTFGSNESHIGHHRVFWYYGRDSSHRKVVGEEMPSMPPHLGVLFRKRVAFHLTILSSQRTPL